jgi:hypothetical protein
MIPWTYKVDTWNDEGDEGKVPQDKVSLSFVSADNAKFSVMLTRSETRRLIRILKHVMKAEEKILRKQRRYA